MRIALFITCFNDTLFPGTGRAVVDVLERLGHEVSFPEDQTCCGQMHANSGYQLEAVPLVKRFVRVFADEELVVSPSASCVAMVRDQYPRLAELAGDAGLARECGDRAACGRAHRAARRPARHTGRQGLVPHRVTLHTTCHSLRLLHVGDRPRRLLEAVRGIDLVELADADECCGFGGTFAIKNADTSMAMLSDKLRRILDTRAEVCVAADNSCLMHIGGALRRRQAGVRTMHLAEVLAAAE